MNNTHLETIIFADTDPLTQLYVAVMRKRSTPILGTTITHVCDITNMNHVRDAIKGINLHKDIEYNLVVVSSSISFNYPEQLKKLKHVQETFKNITSLEQLHTRPDGTSLALSKIIKSRSVPNEFIQELYNLQKVVSKQDPTKWDIDMYNDIITSYKLGLIPSYAGAIPEDLDSFDVVLAPFRNALDKALQDRIKYVRNKIQKHIPLPIVGPSGREDSQIIAHVIMAEQHIKHIIQGAMTLRSAPDLLIVIDTTNRAEKIHYVSNSKEIIYRYIKHEGSVDLFVEKPDIYVHSKILPYGDLLNYISKLI